MVKTVLSPLRFFVCRTSFLLSLSKWFRKFPFSTFRIHPKLFVTLIVKYIFYFARLALSVLQIYGHSKYVGVVDFVFVVAVVGKISWDFITPSIQSAPVQQTKFPKLDQFQIRQYLRLYTEFDQTGTVTLLSNKKYINK